jgi:hypothetical protein
MSGHRIKNWDRFQHYQTGKNAAKRPPWIKLYTELLDDIEFHQLAGDDAKTLILLWMLASENGGVLPPIKTIAFRLRLSEDEINSILGRLPHWLDGPSYENPRTDKKEIRVEEEVEEDKTHVAKSDDGCVKTAFDEYNETARRLNLPVATSLTDGRRKKLRARLGEHGLKGWLQALHNLAELPFCLGKGGRGWKANLDFLLQPSSFQKVLEKTYEQGTGQQSKSMAVTEKLLREVQDRGISVRSGCDNGGGDTGRVIPLPSARAGGLSAPVGSGVRRAPEGTD